MAEHDTLKSLVLAIERARWNEKIHQDGCRARKARSECVSCDANEAAWLAADRRLQDFLDAAAVLEAAAKTADGDDRFSLVDAF